MNSPAKIRLSSEQEIIVNHTEGAILVIAGPGSGKTRVLTERIRNLLTKVPGHFRVLALTFTNKAADEMRDRLSDLEAVRDRAFVGTLHSFCLDILTERGKLVGVDSMPNIFEQFKDRKEILLKAIQDDPRLDDEINTEPDTKARGRRVDTWLQTISRIKANPITYAVIEDDLDRAVLEAYDAGMRACNAYDFDDLLLLVYKLLTNNPKLAEFYRKLYRFICIDEAQDLNEAQYAVICALSGSDFKNVMMVGDPKQSIYGFNTSSPKFMERFKHDFTADVKELTANYRSSQAVVNVARSLDENYLVAAQLPIKGCAEVLPGINEADEANIIINKIEYLLAKGHPDVEGPITPSNFAILGRTRFALLEIEKELRNKNIPFFKRLSANHENESDTVDDFELALRVIANPRDRLHFSALAKKWAVHPPQDTSDALSSLKTMATSASTAADRAKTVVNATEALLSGNSKLDLMQALATLKKYADTLPENERLAIYEDSIVLENEWDQYLRAERSARNIGAFMSNKALGNTQKTNKEGVALLTVHSAKGLEFDVVFIAGMAQGTFPDYRATTKSALLEEQRNAFVAVTRSKRLLYLTYPQNRIMPWGDSRRQTPSVFISGITN